MTQQPLDLTAIRARHDAAVDPAACGTCRTLTANGKPTLHPFCARRATLLPAPDAPCYETILDVPEDQRANMPARFHTPVFVADSSPKAWVCAVCWGDGWTTRWPCQTATEHGTDVFTPEHKAEAGRQDVGALLARVRELEAENAELITELDGRDEEARERWINKQLDQTAIRSMEFRNGAHMDLEPARELVAHWVAAARTMLGDAPNYSETKIEFDVKVAESPEMYTLVVQRHAPGALTPHEARQRAETDAETSRVRLWLIEQHISRNESVFPLDLVPYIDGPLHPSDIDAYRNATA